MEKTGIIYSSTERTPVVLPELSGLLPPLTEEQAALLEQDLLKNGCIAPIVVNEDLAIVDGHNRQAICEKHGIPYQMWVFHFDDLLDAMRWAVDTQKGRRNLDKWELGKIALKLKPALEARGKANMSAGGGDQKSQEVRKKAESQPQVESVPSEGDAESGIPKSENPISPVNTCKEMAKSVGIAPSTMGQIIQIDEKAPQAVKDALDNKEISVNKGYEITRQVQDLPEEEREQAAVDALTMQKVQKELKKADDEAARRSKIAGQFSKTYIMVNHLSDTEEDVGYWVECSRMTPQEIHNDAVTSRAYAEKFLRIAELLEAKLPPDFKPFEDEVMERIAGGADD